jgi:hypothetical protein
MAKPRTLCDVVTNIQPTDRVCFNCKSFTISLGKIVEIRCTNAKKQREDKKPKLVHPSDEACEYFVCRFSKEPTKGTKKK